MLVKIMVLVILFAAIFVSDGPKWKKFGPRERIAYSVIMTVAVYLSVDFVADMNLPNLDELLNVFLADPAKRIVESIKLPS
ncbi:hypothetical protein [Paenibacillus sp. LHD-38]|uniref:hypothetical protein n=1 Tax=Paenibacillus sp. LHD-38 TaxID=3072143 RepID=UPI00280ECF77|nr:hypothetical protein [Paenibacillus sp. LHD-38]MDQ8733522.1 hypothetical protein [Paenibacillus sp. LHD-38]